MDSSISSRSGEPLKPEDGQDHTVHGIPAISRKQLQIGDGACQRRGLGKHAGPAGPCGSAGAGPALATRHRAPGGASTRAPLPVGARRTQRWLCGLGRAGKATAGGERGCNLLSIFTVPKPSLLHTKTEGACGNRSRKSWRSFVNHPEVGESTGTAHVLSLPSRADFDLKVHQDLGIF